MGKIKTIGPLEVDASGAIEINSSAGTIDIGNDAVAQDITIGVGPAARTIKIGNTTAATGVDIGIGSGDFTLSSASGLLISQLDTGEMTKPLQPAFLGILESIDNNVTGAGANYTLGTNIALTEIFDQGGDFNTNGTFTAPVTGRYQLNFALRFRQITAAMTVGSTVMVTSNRDFQFLDNPAAERNGSDGYSIMNSILADMDSGDTVTFTTAISNGAGNTADLNIFAGVASNFVSGCLLV